MTYTERLAYSRSDLDTELANLKDFETRMMDLAVKAAREGRKIAYRLFVRDLDWALVTAHRHFLENCVDPELKRLEAA